MSGFLLKLKEGKTAPLPRQRLEAERPQERLPVTSIDATPGSSGSSDPVPVKTCHSFLQVFTKPEKVKPSTFGGEDIYVIIGRGPAATTNLATLRSRHGSRRIHGKSVFVVGMDDPWSHYVSHNMNQEAELLSLPGYEARPGLSLPAAVPNWMDSKRFAKFNRLELTRASLSPSPWRSFRAISAGVTSIEKIKDSGSAKERYKVHFKGHMSPIIATHVDICTGTGQQVYAEGTNNEERGIGMCEELWSEYLNPATKREHKPRVISAEMFVVGPCQVIPGASVLITSANSPAGLQAGEHAFGLDRGSKAALPASEVFLVSAATMNDGFLPIGRLDGLARIGAHELPVRTKIPSLNDVLTPNVPGMWFGEFYRAKQIEILNEAHVDSFVYADGDAPITMGRKVLVTFARQAVPARMSKENDKLAARVVRGGRAHQVKNVPAEAVLYGLFDQVVISTGRARGGRVGPEKEAGSAMELVWDFKNELEVIKAAGYEFPVGLQDKNGSLRILGAAGINNPIYHADEVARKELLLYEKSLPIQARVNNEGITLATLTVAIANRYFNSDAISLDLSAGVDGAVSAAIEPVEPDINVNVNTATRRELMTLLGDELGGKIFLLRHNRIRPFHRMDEVWRAMGYDLNKRSVAPAVLIRQLNDYDHLMSDWEWGKYVNFSEVDRRAELQIIDEKLEAILRDREEFGDVLTMDYEDFIGNEPDFSRERSRRE